MRRPICRLMGVLAALPLSARRRFGLLVGLVVLAYPLLPTNSAAASPAATAVAQQYAINVNCTSAGERCTPPYTVSMTTAGQLDIDYQVPSQCSSIRLHILLDGTELPASVSPTPWLGWPGGPSNLPLDTGLIHVGPTTAGTHTLGLEAEGQVGGCNTGSLVAWGGSVTIYSGPASPSDYPSTVLTDNPISYWRLNETSGGTAHDQRGNSDGSIGKGVTLNQIPGAVPGGSSMKFDNGIIAINGNMALQPADWSVEAWVRSTSQPSQGGMFYRFHAYGLNVMVQADGTITSNVPVHGPGVG